MNFNKKKARTIVIIGAVVGIIGLNLFTITPAGHTKVQTCLGEVTPTHFGEGLHFPVTPYCGFDTYDTREFKYEINKINVPTQDRFSSTANVTALIRVEPKGTPGIKKNYGNMDEFLDKTIRQQLRSMLRDEGRKLEDSRSLAQSDKVSNMQDSLKARLTVALEGKISVNEVLVQDIEFDPRISKQILATQQRIQKEESEASQLRIQKTVADQAIEKARGSSESKKLEASAEQFRLESIADGKAHAQRVAAEAERYELEQRAHGNKALNKSLTNNILKLKALEVQQVEAGNGWNGQLPNDFSPVYGDGNGSSAPFLLKNLK
ncbi:hypothetical protein L4C33_20735 [Vibrio makurazakiensis]|uniref:SPFH domain-containing protein n=1 Tax=Vibrio makurazakiensis TaxID=2910250 RepID=UPI003D113CE7